VRNLQGTENARQDKLESARIGNLQGYGIWREMESVRNGISKELNLQGLEFARNGICKYHHRSLLIPFLANSFPCKYCSLLIPFLDFLDKSIPCKFTWMRIVGLSLNIPFHAISTTFPCEFNPLQIQRPRFAALRQEGEEECSKEFQM